MSKSFEDLAKSADKAFNTVPIYINDAIMILDDLCEFKRVMRDNGYEYDLNEKEGKYTEDLDRRITELGTKLIGRKEFEEYINTKGIYMKAYDRNYYRSQIEEFKKKQKEDQPK